MTHVMTLLVHLVTDRIFGSRGTGAEGSIRVLGNRLVGLRGSLGGGALDGLRDVVGSVPDGQWLATTMSGKRKARPAYLTESIAKVVWLK